MDVNRTVNAETLAKDLFRQDGLNEKLSTSGTLRFGNKGSMVVNTEGSHAGTWRSFESGEGGNMISLVQREKGLDFKGSLDFMKPYCSGSVQQDIEGFLQGEKIRAVSSAEKEASKRESLALQLDQIKEKKKKEALKVSEVKALIEKSVSIEGTPAARYLREERGLNSDLPESLRYLAPGTDYAYDGQKKRIYSGALVAVATDRDGTTKALQLTYLTKEGARYRVQDGSKAIKITLGVQKGSFVQLQKASKQGLPLVMAEGVEKALSLKEAGVKGQIVCSLGTSNMRNINTSSEKVIIAADWDGSYDKPSWKETEKTKDRLIQQGKDVSVLLPVSSPKEDARKIDFDDVLIEKGVGSVRAVIRDQDEGLLKGSVNTKDREIKTYDNTIQRDQTETQGHKHGISTKYTKIMEKAEYPHQDNEKVTENFIKPLLSGNVQKEGAHKERVMSPTEKRWRDHFDKSESNGPKKERKDDYIKTLLKERFDIDTSVKSTKETKIIRETKTNSKGIDIEF